MTEPTIILSNQVRCDKCGDDPYSATRHDYKSCKCGAIAVDGGQAYLRRVGDIHGYTELSIEIPKTAADAAMARIKWARDTGRNDLGILCAAAIALRDNGVDLMPKGEPIAYLRDIDGTGSLHPCAADDRGAIPVYR